MKLTDITFTDENFKQCVLATGAEDTKEITRLVCRRKKISSLNGIEHLSELAYLDLTRNALSTVDLSKNTKLEEILIGNNFLQSLNVTGCSALTHLELFMNDLETLDVSRNTALEELWASQNELESIDLRQNTALLDLRLEHNNLTDIDLCPEHKLNRIDIENNPLSDSTRSTIEKLEVVHG